MQRARSSPTSALWAGPLVPCQPRPALYVRRGLDAGIRREGREAAIRRAMYERPQSAVVNSTRFQPASVIEACQTESRLREVSSSENAALNADNRRIAVEKLHYLRRQANGSSILANLSGGFLCDVFRT